MSGRCSSQSADCFGSVRGRADDGEVWLAVEESGEALADDLLVVGDDDSRDVRVRVHLCGSICGGQGCFDQEAAACCGAVSQLAANCGRAFAHADQPVAGGSWCRWRAGAVVADAEVEGLAVVGELDVDGRARRVPAGVGEGFLRDAVGGEFDGGIESAWAAAQDEPRCCPGGSRASSIRSVEPGECLAAAGAPLPPCSVSWRRTPTSWRISVERRPGGVADCGELSRTGCGHAGGGDAGGLCLNGDHRDVVCDDVVELPCDPCAFAECAVLSSAPAMSCWAACWAVASRRAFRVMPPNAAAGARTANRSVRNLASELAGREPANASTRNGTERTIDAELRPTAMFAVLGE